MITASAFRAIVSGQRRGLDASVIRCGFRLIEFPYTWAVRRRNRAFDNGRKTIHQAGVPVISVGNVTMGGTGKTPMVAWLAQRVADEAKRVAIVSRGYGSKPGSPNDEALELSNRLPDIPHIQNPDRVAAAETAVRQHQAECIVLDDGFQHRRLARDLDIVLLDALEPFGYEHVFPRGTLREPIAGLARADVVVLSRADAVDKAIRQQIHDRVRGLSPNADWVEVTHHPTELINSTGETAPIQSLAGKPVAAFCGIGNPSGFRHTLESSRYDVVKWREFPDHFDYVNSDVNSLREWLLTVDCEAAVCTHKDLVKVARDQIGGKPLWALKIDIEFLTGRDLLLAKLAAC
jgi:tetraacyldisaccharide 4'-kinase